MPKPVKTNQLFERFVVCGLSPELLCTVAGEAGFLGTNFRYRSSLVDQLPHTNGDNSGVPPQLPAVSGGAAPCAARHRCRAAGRTSNALPVHSYPIEPRCAAFCPSDTPCEQLCGQLGLWLGKFPPSAHLRPKNLVFTLDIATVLPAERRGHHTQGGCVARRQASQDLHGGADR